MKIKQAQEAIKSKDAVQALGAQDTELEAKVSELNSIQANDLEAKGQEEQAKEENTYYKQLEIDYSDPKIINHKKDIDKIAEANERLTSRLIEGLRDFDIDCKTVGAKRREQEIEPSYYLEIEKEQEKDTIYNQTFCEELRNKYHCSNQLTLKCIKKGMRWKE